MRLEDGSVIPFVSLATQILINFCGSASAETLQRKNLFKAHHLFWPFFLFNNCNCDG